jgi:hypothetical protein
MLAVFKQFAIAAGTAAVEGLVNLVRGKRRDSLPEVDVTVSEPPHPGFKDIEHQRAQERASILASKAAEASAARNATTARPPRRKSGRLPSE